MFLNRSILLLWSLSKGSFFVCWVLLLSFKIIINCIVDKKIILGFNMYVFKFLFSYIIKHFFILLLFIFYLLFANIIISIYKINVMLVFCLILRIIIEIIKNINIFWIESTTTAIIVLIVNNIIIVVVIRNHHSSIL